MKKTPSPIVRIVTCFTHFFKKSSFMAVQLIYSIVSKLQCIFYAAIKKLLFLFADITKYGHSPPAVYLHRISSTPTPH